MAESLSEKLRFVADVKRFGEKTLGLDFGSGFKKIDKKHYECHWLYVSQKYRLDSVIKGLRGRPYLFSWSKERLVKREEGYRKSYDTYLFSSEAHGGGDCPILKSLLDAPKERQLYVILHEGWHSTLGRARPKITMPYSFEESSGRVVGVYGAVLFAQNSGDNDLLRKTERFADEWLMFQKFVNRGYAMLARAYRPGALSVRKSNREKCLGSIRHERDRLLKIIENGQNRSELLKADNNAFFIRYRDYAKHYELMLDIYRNTDSDLLRTMDIFKRIPSDEKKAMKFAILNAKRPKKGL